jgi:hypothetical protein
MKVEQRFRRREPHGALEPTESEGLIADRNLGVVGAWNAHESLVEPWMIHLTN